MTVLTGPPVPLPVSDPPGAVPRDGAEQAQGTAAMAVLPVQVRQVEYGLTSGTAARLRQLSASGHGDVTVLRLRGEPDLLGAVTLQAYLSDIRRQAPARCIVDLTGLAFIDCACLSVLVRHCKVTRRQGSSFALAAPQPAVLRILAVTGLLTWFEVHDTVREAVARAGTRRSPSLLAEPAQPRAQPG
jgi:anti-anti-sigma factor